MSHAAHASRLHWEFVGSERNLAVGEWQVSRVHAVLSQSDAALSHARRALEIATLHELGPFLIACGHEAIARALSVSRPEAALEHLAMAHTIAMEITDPGERKILEDDLSSIRIERGSPGC